MATAEKTPKRTEPSTTGGFTADEKAAMRERAREAKAEATRGADRAAGPRPTCSRRSPSCRNADRVMAEQVHAIVTAIAPDLVPKTWYGMPAYARRMASSSCFFKPASKFDGRYATLGFEEDAHLDDGSMWATIAGRSRS